MNFLLFFIVFFRFLLSFTPRCVSYCLSDSCEFLILLILTGSLLNAL